MTDNLSEEPEKLFASCSHNVDIGFILEVICTHFILSFNDNKGIDLLHKSLFWSCKSDVCYPAVSLTASVTLLKSAIQFSLPSIIQTHAVLLASACIGISPSSACEDKLKMPLNHYMAAFEESIHLYKHILHDVKFDNDNFRSEIQLGFVSTCESDKSSNISYESFIKPAMCSKIKHHISKLTECYGDYTGSGTTISKNRVDQEGLVMAYVKENHHVIEEASKQEVFLFLKHIMSISILRACRKEAFEALACKSWEALFSVAAILKLMSSSLLHIIWAFREMGAANHRNLTIGASAEVYGSMCEVIFSLVHSEVDLVAELSDFPMKPYTTDCIERVEIKKMLAHFIGLFLYSYNLGIVCLWKGSIFMVVVILNLVIFDQGGLNALTLLNCINESLASPSSLSAIPSAGPATRSTQGCRSSSFTIAANFQSTRAFLLKEEPCLTYDINRINYEAVQKSGTTLRRSERLLCVIPAEDKNSGELCTTKSSRSNELYLGCIGCSKEDIDELADFIDYTSGKDYTGWMENKKKFRKWKAGKSLLARYHKRSSCWDQLRNNKHKRKRPC